MKLDSAGEEEWNVSLYQDLGSEGFWSGYDVVESGSGFGIGTTVVALLATLLVGVRWRQ